MRLIDADRLNDAMYHEAFETDSKMQKWDSGCWIRYKMFENHLDEAPTIEQPTWIPCSERLPEYRKLVLVTTRDLRVKPAYLDSIQDNGTDDWWSIPLDDADCASWNIVAWMPLPEPWKGADDE